jgi:hypothetical protein
MEKLITLSDIQAIRQITSNVDDVNSIDPYITEAQNVDLRRLLGIKFFNVLRKELATTPTPPARATDILNGKLYTVDEVEIEYLGIKPLIAYYAYARAITNLGKRVARFGVVKKVTSFSEHAEDKEVSAMVIEAKSNAKVYEEDLLYFLDNNKTVYPEFFTEPCSGQIKPAIRITAVGGGTPSYE